MKILVLTAALCLSLQTVAQTTEVYYDFYWKPCGPSLARYYSTVQKTDSGWLRHDYFVTGPTLQMRALYADKDCKIKNGHAVYYYANGQLQAAGRYQNNKLQGTYLRYHSNGMMADSAAYRDDIPTGSRILWHRSGYMSDSIYRISDSMQIHVRWFEDGNLAAAGYLLHQEPYGKWRYHHRNGTIAGEVVYKEGEVLSAAYFNEDGSPQPDTANANVAARFKKGGTEGWKKYVEKNLFWPHGLRLANTTQVTVGVEFYISPEGKIIDAEITVPFHPEFDRIALNTIRNSPDWLPAIEHNRKVLQRFRQSVTFLQEE